MSEEVENEAVCSCGGHCCHPYPTEEDCEESNCTCNKEECNCK